MPLIVVAYSTLGFVFGVQGGRPGWYSALQAPAFVVLATISSLGVLAVFAACCRRALRMEERITPGIFRWLGNALWVCTLVYLYLIGVEELTNRYAAIELGGRGAPGSLEPSHAWMFIAMLAGFALPLVLLFAQFLRGTVSIPIVVACGVLVNVAGILKRFLIVVPSQTRQMLLPYPAGSYEPTWVEYSVVGGLLALGTLTLLVFAKLFPIVPVDLDDGASAARHQTRELRAQAAARGARARDPGRRPAAGALRLPRVRSRVDRALDGPGHSLQPDRVRARDDARLLLGGGVRVLPAAPVRQMPVAGAPGT